MTVSTSESLEKRHIVATPGICGGKPCIAGTRIRVLDIFVWHDRQGKCPDEIVSLHPQLTLGDDYAALTWIWDNREKVLSEMAEELRISGEIKSQYPSKLPVKSAGTDGTAIPS